MKNILVVIKRLLHFLGFQILLVRQSLRAFQPFQILKTGKLFFNGSIFLALLAISCQNSNQEPKEATLFAPGIISSELPEFATTIHPNDNTIYFNRTNPDRSVMQIMVSNMADGNWSEPEALPFSTGTYLDVDPFLSVDGSRLYFSSTRPIAEGDTTGQFNTWYIEKMGGSWSDPINPGAPLNSDSTEIFISLSKNGNAYFVTERDGDRGISVSRFENGQYQAPEKIRLKLRGQGIYASNPCIASDESFLIVASRDPQGPGTPDLFVSRNKNGQWSEMQNLGPLVNTEYAEFAPGLSKDDQTLYFSSERPGMVPPQAEGVRPPGDIYQVDLNMVLKTLVLD